jgi:hypothetical protein
MNVAREYIHTYKDIYIHRYHEDLMILMGRGRWHSETFSKYCFNPKMMHIHKCQTLMLTKWVCDGWQSAFHVQAKDVHYDTLVYMISLGSLQMQPKDNALQER